MADLSVFERLKSKQDYDRMEQEFQLKKQLARAEIEKAQKMGAGTADVQNYNFVRSLPPEEQIKFLNIKRADQIMNLGGQMAVRNPFGGIQETYTVNPKISETPDFQAKIAAAEKLASLEAERESEKIKKSNQAGQVISLAGEAEKILPKATAGAVGQLYKYGASKLGYSTEASQADARLKTIAAALTSNVPRFEGPQGVLDVELYKQAAGDVANTDLPYQDRIAALGTIKELNARYLQNKTEEPRTFSAENPVMPIDESMLDMQMPSGPKMPPAAGMTPPEMSAPSIKKGTTATNPQTGERVMFDGKEWKKIK